MANYFGTPPDLNKGVPTLFAYCEKIIWNFFFKFTQGTCLCMAFAWIFFLIFLTFFEGGLWGKSFMGNIEYFGAQIFPVVWPLFHEEERGILFMEVCSSACLLIRSNKLLVVLK